MSFLQTYSTDYCLLHITLMGNYLHLQNRHVANSLKVEINNFLMPRSTEFVTLRGLDATLFKKRNITIKLPFATTEQLWYCCVDNKKSEVHEVL